ncbi:MAG TPA: type II toxin-antitoxin system prevent-host-death family antitoxin [Candidatus Methanoperedens sp.]|nr:type II toxin-antitoxin system prevent-host-death family antitoxin [Candidatus Methanoperedens sp.]
MKSVGIRELKENAGKVLRGVREAQEAVEITYHGRAIARIVPVPPSKAEPRRLAKIWSDLDRLSEEIGARWPKGVSAVAAVKDQRR